MNNAANLKLSIIICTYNRIDLLQKCITSLLPQLNEKVELIIIDNNSTDNTQDICQNYAFQYNKINYIFEGKKGLSFARNKGLVVSNAEWILFLDDDTIAFPDLVDRALVITNQDKFACVGGYYKGYAEMEMPKWVPNSFGTMQYTSNDLTQCAYYIPIGLNVMYKRKVALSLGGFKTDLGMVAEKKFLGEETELQYRMSNNAYLIGFDPNLKVYHLIKKEYLTLSHFFKRGFYDGFANGKIYKSNTINNFYLLTKSILSFIFKRVPIVFYKFIFYPNYFYQNAILEACRPVLLNYGKLKANFSKQN